MSNAGVITRRQATATMVGLAMAGFAGGAGKARAQPLRSVEINYGAAYISPAVAPLFSVPQAAGFWKEDGLDVTVHGVAGGGNALQQLIHGNVVMTVSGTPEFFSSRTGGASVIAVANAYDRNTYYPVVPTAGSINSAADLIQLKGKAIGYPSLDGGDTIFGNLMLRSVGLDPDRDITKIVAGAPVTGLYELKTGRVDALLYWESAYAQMEVQGGGFRRIDKIPVLDPLAFVQGFFTSNQLVQQEPKLIAGLLRGMAKGLVFANENPETAVHMHWDVFPLTKPAGLPNAEAMRQAKFILQDQMKTFQNALNGRFGAVSLPMVEAMRDVLFDAKQIKAKLPPEEYFTDRFLNEANDFDHAAVRTKAQAVNFQTRG